MNTYGFSAYVRGFDTTDDAQLLALSELDFDASVGGRDGNTIVDISIDARTPFQALSDAIAGIETCGLRANRIDFDLVTVSEIAERAGTNRESVRLWSVGKRRSGFPRPFATLGTSAVWAWSDVFPWLVSNGQQIDDLYEDRPIPTDVILRFNGNLARAREISSTWKDSSNTVRMSNNVTRQRRTRTTTPSPWAWGEKVS